MRFGRPGPWTLVRIASGAGIGVALLWWVWRDVDNRALVDRILEYPLALLPVVFALLLISAVVRSYRWSLLLPPGTLSIGRLFLVENTGIAFNNVSPIRILAEPIQLAYLTRRYGCELGTALASLVLVRVIDLLVTLALIVIGFTLLPPSTAAPRSVWLGIGLLVLAASVVIALSLLSERTPWAGRLAFVRPYADAWRRLAEQPRKLAWIITVTAAFWFVKGGAAFVIARGLQVDLSLPLSLVLMLAVTTLGLTLPGLPSGLGPFEFAATLFLPLYGIADADALAFGLVLHGTFLLPPIVVAIATLIKIGTPWPLRDPNRPQASSVGDG